MRFQLQSLLWVILLVPIAIGVQCACELAGVLIQYDWLQDATVSTQLNLLSVTNDWKGTVPQTIGWSTYLFVGEWVTWAILLAMVFVLSFVGWKELRVFGGLIVCSVALYGVFRIFIFLSGMSLLHPLILAKFLNLALLCLLLSTTIVISSAIRKRQVASYSSMLEARSWFQILSLCAIWGLLLTASAYGWSFFRGLLNEPTIVIGVSL